ncbi:MAG: glycosyltransferase family 2 protein, partial [Anaerolineales bacterium]|nr:glycosyltransferase family 2 protein [Anaerolineales bacterium]
MKLAIIVVSWNTSELLAACLKSVYAYPPQCDFEMWVVDNASKDDSVAMVQQHFPQVRLIVNEANVGFAQANNQAICDSDSEYVLLLNPDTEVKPGAIQHLIDFIEAHPKVGATGSRLLNPDGSLQISCHPMPTLAREFWRMFYMDDFFPYGRYPMRRWDMETPRDVDVIQGASFLLRRTVLNTVGFLDDTYFMYSEEVDLCFRLQKAGWR